ncbi:uncharacterized protein C8Q71DRAFT_378230 [Rhodofomes roseus]|nr:uncharacterized protein C8Q71DRAFT_378230 [Rhodofomes roseus]KAH9830105.1 hypothetical protein C8Q71DRAFT_378230 [Rhodofomes roseus]
MAVINEACNIGFNSNAWLHYDGTSMSAYHYFTSNQASALNGAALAGAFFTVILADGYLLVRCYRWWKNLWVIIPLAMLMLVSYVWDFFELVYTAGHAVEANSGWVMPFFGSWPITIGLAGALHLIYTVLLASRVITHARKTCMEVLGLWEISVESAFPYGFVSLVFMILYCSNSVAANGFIPMLVQLQGITVDLLVARTLKLEHRSAIAQLPVPVVAVQTQMVVPTSDSASTTAPSASIYDEKLTLVKMSSMWKASALEKKEPAPPEYPGK